MAAAVLITTIIAVAANSRKCDDYSAYSLILTEGSIALCGTALYFLGGIENGL